MIDREETNTIIRSLITPPCSTLSLQAADLLNRYAVEVATLAQPVELPQYSKLLRENESMRATIDAMKKILEQA